MKLKDQLILRKVAGQYVIVPVGKRVHEIPNTVYISSSAAFLWDFMKDAEFTVDSLVEQILSNYVGVTEEVARRDVEGFISVLKKNHILELEPGENITSGSVRIRIRSNDHAGE